jgi:type II secretory pathway pseudopilin PulG
MKKLDELESQLGDWLENPPAAPLRDSRNAAQGKARFMKMVDAELEERHTRHAPLKPVLNWQANAVKALASLLLVAGLLSGGYATVHAAQDDLPDQPLYPLKLAVEDFRLGISPDPQVRLDLLMEMSQTRFDEMVDLLQAGKAIPPSVVERFSNQNRQAMQAAAGLEDARMNAALQKYRARLETQVLVISRLQVQSPAEPALAQIQTMLAAWISQVEDGLMDPQQFRLSIQDEPGNVPTPTPTRQVPTATPEDTPLPAMPENPITSTATVDPRGTPTTGSGNGSGTPMPVRTATPKPNDNKPSGTHKPKPGGMRPANP